MLIARGQRQRKSLALFHIGTSLEVACAGIVDVDGFASRAHEDHPGGRVCRRSFGGSSTRESVQPGYNSQTRSQAAAPTGGANSKSAMSTADCV